MVEFSLESRSDRRSSRTLFFSIELFSDEQVANFLLYGSEHLLFSKNADLSSQTVKLLKGTLM